MPGYALFGRSVASNGNTMLFEIEEFRQASLSGFSPVSSIGHEFSRDGRYFVIGGVRHFVEDKSFEVVGPTLSSSSAFDFSWDSSLYAVGASAQPRVQIYNTGTWVMLPQLPVAPNLTPRKMAFSPSGGHLVVTFLNSTTNWVLYRTDTWAQAALPTIEGNGYEAKFSPDGAYLAVAHGDGDLASLFTFPDLQSISIPSGSANAAVACDWSPDGRYLAFAFSSALGGSDCLVVLDANNGFARVTGMPVPSAFSVTGNHVRFSPDGRYLAFTSGTTPRLIVYDIATWGIKYAHTGSSVDSPFAVSWSHSPVLDHHSGRILGHNGLPVQRRKVLLASRDDPSFTLATETGRNGQYAFDFKRGVGVGGEYNRIVFRDATDPASLNDLIDRVTLV